MDTPHLHFSDPALEPLRLDATHALGWQAGRVQLVAEPAAAALWIHNRPHGLWLTRTADAPALHLNGRKIRRIAWLRCGDVLHVGTDELRLSGAPPVSPAGATATAPPAISADRRVLLRGVSGPHHGCRFTLERPLLIGRSSEADVRIDDPAFTERHAQLEWVDGRLRLRDLGSAEGSLVNGHPVRDAVLAPGDQIIFATHERFVVETPLSIRPTPVPPVDAPAMKTAADEPSLLPSTRWSHLLWLLLAATLLASGLVLLLLFGAG